MLSSLSTIRRSDAAACGSKAACLGELASRGYPVPTGLVLTTTAFERFVADNGLAPLLAERMAELATERPARLVEIEREVLASFTAARLPHEIQTAIAGWLHRSGLRRLAVRSSATTEDLPGASGAGMYSSFLHVAPCDVPVAVIRCFASLFSARAALYRRLRNVNAVGAMAVVVQEMLAADHGGVVFTVAPRRPATLLVEGTEGVGDAVVSGRVSPSRYYLDRATLRIEEACERSPLDHASVRAVARCALAIERDLGAAQDVEYGLVDGTVYVLQARPATATACTPSRIGS